MKKMTNYVKQKFLNTTIQTKLLIVFILLILFPTSVNTIVSSYFYQKEMVEKTKETMQDRATKSLMEVEEKVNLMLKTSILPEYFLELEEYLEQENPTVRTQNRIQFYLTMMVSTNDIIETIYLFDKYNRMYYESPTWEVRKDISYEYPLLKEISHKQTGVPQFLGVKKIKNNVNEDKYILSVVKEIKNRLLEPIGVIVIETDLSFIQEKFHNIDQSLNSQSIILDQNQYVIYATDEQLIGSHLPSHPEYSYLYVNKHRTLKKNNEEFMIIHSSTSNGWESINVIPIQELTKEFQTTRNSSLFLNFIMIGIALIASIAFAKIMTKPIKRMIGSMEEIQKGNFNVSIIIEYLDEIGQLGLHFNKMVKRIQNLIEEVYINKILKQEAEMKALQSQINPHFLYNTLECIRMTSEINDDEEVSEMLFILGKMLRYSVNKKIEIVTIEKEFSYLKDYITIHNFRRNRDQMITLNLNVENKLLIYPIIKLLFQPIVENAVIHGFDSHKQNAIITISSQTYDSTVEWTIKDNGCGMSERKLQGLREMIEISIDSNDYGLGLKNVNDRIKSKYGKDFGLKIKSTIGIGTEVKMSLPYVLEKY